VGGGVRRPVHARRPDAEPEDFFEREGAWSVAQAPGVDPREPTASTATASTTPSAEQTPADLASESSTNRFIPYYTMFRAASGEGAEFVLLRPFVPFSRADERTELQAYMTASSDPDTYGQLTAYVVESPLPEGPRTVSNQIDSEPSIAQQITLQTGGGNRVRFGDLQLVPVADGLLWIRPFYAAVPQSSDRATTVTEYRFVIVAYDGRAAYGESLGEALAKLFPGFDEDLGDRVGTVEESEGEETPPPESGEPSESTPAELLAQADQLLADADLALEGRDLAGYQANVEEAKALIDQALELLTASGG